MHHVLETKALPWFSDGDLIVSMSTLVLLIHAGSTLSMVGLIWLVQVVHYPLFKRVSPDFFRAYHAAHTQRVTWVVMPLMLVEGATACVLALSPPPPVSAGLAWGGVILGLIAWGTTFLVSVPLHGVLSRSFDTQAHARLVSTNWIRTLAWSARGVVALWMIALVLEPETSSSATRETVLTQNGGVAERLHVTRVPYVPRLAIECRGCSSRHSAPGRVAREAHSI